MAASSASPFPSPTMLTLLRSAPGHDHRLFYRRSFSPNSPALTDSVPAPSSPPVPRPLPIRRREAALSLSLLLILLDPPAGASSGLAFCDTVVGTGTGATKGQLIKAHYVGKLENGKVFDSSYSRWRAASLIQGGAAVKASAAKEDLIFRPDC